MRLLRRHYGKLAAALLLAVALGTAYFAWQAMPSENDEDYQVREILAARDPTGAADHYRDLFKATTSEGLRRLQKNPSDTIAIQSAWQEVELTVPERANQVVRPDPEKLSRFIGFLERRAHVLAPKWWSEALLDARANRRGNVYAGGLNIVENRQKERNATTAPGQASVDRLEGHSVVRVGSESARIPEDLGEKLGSKAPGDGVCALITPSNCYIAVYDSWGYPYQLVCVNRSSAKTRWVAEVWASWWRFGNGRSHQWVEITEQGNRVVVFGVASMGFHVEAFRAEDGVNILRFSNMYSAQ
jgi:hypothetical protein